MARLDSTGCLRRMRGRLGQAMIEFIAVMGMTLGVALILFLFLGTFLEFAYRGLRLVALEYP